MVSTTTELQVCLYQLINFIDFDAVDKWIDRYWQAVWSILFVLAGVRRRRNRSALFLLSYSHFTSVTTATIPTIESVNLRLIGRIESNPLFYFDEFQWNEGFYEKERVCGILGFHF